MPSERTPQYLADILEAARRIQEYTKNFRESDFSEDEKTLEACERLLLVISEAAIRLGPDAEELCPTEPWANIRGLGNWIRHTYDHLSLPDIWKTVKEDVPQLQRTVEQALKENYPDMPLLRSWWKRASNR